MNRIAQPSFDPVCQEVAEHFLPRGAGSYQVAALSQVIQNAVEDWLASEAKENPASDIAARAGCTCHWVGEGNDPDAHVRRDEWCPLHGRDPDQEYQAMMDGEQ